MSKYTLSPRAKQDIADIQKYTNEKWGNEQAKQYITLLRNKIRMLAKNPDLGKNRDDVKEGYRSFPEGQHIIFYRQVKDKIEILGIPHQSMDVLPHFEHESPTENLN